MILTWMVWLLKQTEAGKGGVHKHNTELFAKQQEAWGWILKKMFNNNSVSPSGDVDQLKVFLTSWFQKAAL